MQENEPFTIISLIPGLKDLPSHVVLAVFVAVLLVVCGGLATMLSKKKDVVVPERTLTFRNLFDLIAEQIYQLCESVMGDHAAKEYFPVVATLFLFVLTNNVIGLFPGMIPATENTNVTLAAGVFVFLYYNFHGIRSHGPGYIKHFFGPVWYLAPLMFFIEVVSHIFRPVTLALRLRGNMMGDHAVLGVFTSLAPYGIPVIFYGLGLFVAFVQAFVFCLLTMVYINLSTAHDH